MFMLQLNPLNKDKELSHFADEDEWGQKGVTDGKRLRQRCITNKIQ